MIVLDASAVVELLLGLPRAASVADRIADPDLSLHAPHLLGVETAQVVRRFVRAGVVTADRGAQALVDLVDLDVERHEHEPLLPRVWELRDSVTAYDATYLALAEVLDAPLLTLDARLARSAGHTAAVELL
ncbi:type II toxin-antitoxin system VapC family toxin [Phycicoccus avicenniae]|uniref:type II toxin-antitoxin system VapC family toxin n=1 Tax=Phycicoccus avicenniae TaxID=2828860 RepID=UPI003D2D91A4